MSEANKLPMLSREQADWIWSLIDIRGETECWPWIGGSISRGYGNVKIKQKNYSGPRLAFLLMYGGDPWPCDIMHACDTPACANPHHMGLGTRGDNNRDRTRKGRTAKGEDHSQAVLTEQRVLEMIKLRKQGWSFRSIGEEYGVTTMTAWHAVSLEGRSWRWLKT
jgi:hypothetical protein